MPKLISAILLFTVCLFGTDPQTLFKAANAGRTLSIDDAAGALGISASTAKRHWAYARAWLFDALRPSDRSPSA